MIKAEEARAFVQEFKAQTETAYDQKAKNYCENTVSPLIERSARVGKSKIVLVSYPKDIKHRIIDTLKANDFAVSDNIDGAIVVAW